MQKCIFNLTILFQAKKKKEREKGYSFPSKQSLVKYTLWPLLEL